MDVRVWVGSKKGAFILESDAGRRDWRLRGPFCEPAVVRLPPLLTALFPDAERVVRLEARTVEENGLEARWPGMRDRLCDTTPAIRRHVNVFPDGRRARTSMC